MIGAIQMTEAYPEVTDQVVAALHKFVPLANAMLKAGMRLRRRYRPCLTTWQGTARTSGRRHAGRTLSTCCNGRSLPSPARNKAQSTRLYDNHPNGQEELLIDTMKESKWSGIPWDLVFSEEVVFSLCIFLHL
jgi:hypothetical protein